MREKFYTVKELNALLPVETSEVFELVDLKRKSTKFLCHYGAVNIERMSLQQAEVLFNAGAPFIKLKTKKKADKDESGTD